MRREAWVELRVQPYEGYSVTIVRAYPVLSRMYIRWGIASTRPPYLVLSAISCTVSRSRYSTARSYLFYASTTPSLSPPHAWAAASGARIASRTPDAIRHTADRHIAPVTQRCGRRCRRCRHTASTLRLPGAFSHSSRLATAQPSSVLALGSVLAGGALALQAHAGVAPSSAHGASAARRLVDQKSVGQRATRARERERRADFCERRKLLQLLSQLLPRHALQVSIDKERASPPPRPLKRKPITAIREAAAPASASPARYNPGYLSL